MRQALGLRNGPSGAPVPQRREAEQRGRRFVKDGEVPVVVVHSARESGIDGAPPVNRIAAAESLARNERSAREHAERALAEAQTTIQHLRTQLAHAEMAHREALAVERRNRELVETALREANEARAAADARAAERAYTPLLRRARTEASASVDTPAGQDAETVITEPASAVRRRGRPRKVAVAATPEAEQEPVQWWLPSFRAARSKR